MDERMVGNFRDQQVAFEAAEAALRVGEDIVLDKTSFDSIADTDWLTSGNSANGLYSVDQGLDPIDGTHTRVEVATATVKGDSASNPSYFLERLPEVKGPKQPLMAGEPPQVIRHYRVTSRADGLTTNSQVVLQSTVYR
jgi:type IV pilus assembly protein PilX